MNLAFQSNAIGTTGHRSRWRLAHALLIGLSTAKTRASLTELLQ
jgi:hypothetical protein